MIERPAYLKQLAAAVRRSPVTALMGPRQCGKTTLARMFQQGKTASYFDLESPADTQRLQSPEMMLGSLKGLVVQDEIQVLPALFNILGSASTRCRGILTGCRYTIGRRWLMAQVPLQKNPIVKQCTGCENIEGDACRIWASPVAKWRLGACPSATHVKIEIKGPEEKVRVGQQKQKKK